MESPTKTTKTPGSTGKLIVGLDWWLFGFDVHLDGLEAAPSHRAPSHLRSAEVQSDLHGGIARDFGLIASESENWGGRKIDSQVGHEMPTERRETAAAAFKSGLRMGVEGKAPPMGCFEPEPQPSEVAEHFTLLMGCFCRGGSNHDCCEVGLSGCQFL